MNWTRRLRINHLHLLSSLAETGNLSDTAKALHTTQPGLSKWLKELEEDIGASLFERHSRGLQPTAMGQLMVGHARRIINEMARAQYDVEALKDGSSRTIIVGTSPASAPTFVPSAIKKFLQKYPKSRIEIQEGIMNSLLKKLESGKLDIVVGRMDNYQPHSTLFSEVLYRESLNIVASTDHPLAGKTNLKWDELYDYDWIVWPTGTPIRSKLDIAVTAAGKKPPNYRIESTSQIGNLWLVQYSTMLSVVSERVALYLKERGLLSILDISLDGDKGAIGMCWRDEAHLDESTLELLECFRQSAPISQEEF